MKTIAVGSRYLLGVIFLTFGLNGFFPFLPMPAPTGTLAQFFGALYVSGYLKVIFALQVIPALLLLSGRYVPLALTLLGPVVVNILLVHFLMAPSGIPLALLVTILWFVVFSSERAAFAGLFRK